MTPEAVIDRYLEAVAAEPLDQSRLALLLGTDADLLSRWLLLLACPADPGAMTAAIAALPRGSLHDLALAQAVAVLSVPGSVRLGFDQWRAALTASLVAEALAHELGIADAEAFRWRVLLAASGVMLPHDPSLAELQAFRGSRRDLLEDASIEHRVFAVVEAFAGADLPTTQDAARQLLNLDADRFRALVGRADARREELLAALGLSADRDADTGDRVWLRLQLGILAHLLASGRPDQALLEAHRLISRRLFGRVPVLFLTDAAGERLVRLDGAGPEISRYSQTSVIARCVRLAERSELIARADQAVADRQVLRSLGSDEGTCLPVVDSAGSGVGALIFTVDDESDPEPGMAIYAAAMGRRLGRAGAAEAGDSDLARYQQREEKRLRELVHEANNPLSIVNNYLHILELKLAHEPETVEQLRLIGAELRRTSAIITQARNLLPLEAARQESPAEPADLDLNELARQLVELHLGLAGDAGVTLSHSFDAGSLHIRSDRQRLSQILNNLLRNAIEAAPGASVTVSTVSGVFREGREGVLLGVADSGPGLPREVAERLAEPKQSTKSGDHAGLGLQIVHRLVAELGGSIDIRTGSGQGTSFAIFLPLRPAPSPQERSPERD